MKILVLGSQGQLGMCLNDQLQNMNHEIIFTSRIEIDISLFEQSYKKIKKISPDIIINASAYTNVDFAEKEKNKANLVNHLSVENIANICKKIEARLIHISTDYVFDGSSNKAYSESDACKPCGVYGDTKYKGEQAVLASNCEYIIIRTSWLFSEYGTNFMKTMLNLGSTKDSIKVINDQIGCPTYAQDLAKVITKIVELNDISKFKSNIYHYCGDKACSWYEFATAIFKQASKMGLPCPKIIKPINTSEYKTLANRPFNSEMNCNKIMKDYDINRSDWRTGIKTVLKKIK